MREIGKLYRLEGQLVRSGRGYCLRREPEGAIWNLTLQDDVSNLLDRIVCVEGIKSATKTIDVYWIAEAETAPTSGSRR